MGQIYTQLPIDTLFTQFCSYDLAGLRTRKVMLDILSKPSAIELFRYDNAIGIQWNIY